MNITQRLQRSWLIFKASLQLLHSQPKLLLFPLVTGLATFFIAAFFLLIPLAAIVLQPTGHGLTDPAHWSAIFAPGLPERIQENYGHLTFEFGMPVLCGFIYLASMFIASFSNVAFYHQIMSGFSGGTVSVREGLSFAGSRATAILMWSLLASTVGLIIKSIAERTGFLGSLVMRFVGLAWSVASVFVIPILVREDCRNPLKALKTSVSLLRETWGESLVGYIGLGMLNALALLGFLAGLLVCALSFLVIKSAILLAGTAGALLLAFLAYCYLSNIAGEIYRCALYIYATEGEIPGGFTSELLDSAWKLKKS